MTALLFTIIYAVIFIAVVTHNKSGKKRSPVNQLTRFRGNEVAQKGWRDVYDQLPIEVTCFAVSSYEKDEAQDGRWNNYQEAFEYEH
jgi:hypothetical protein